MLFRSGVRVGDTVVDVAGRKPESLAALFRSIWALGDAGSLVPLRLARGNSTIELKIVSADRADFLKKPHLH